MAATNNQLRLQIVTQLDAAGIKATKEQIDQLEKGIRAANSAASDGGGKFGKLEKALGKMPGKIGGITRALGGVAGTVGMMIGAFTTGVEIGNKFVDLQRKFGLLSDTSKELAANNKKYDESIRANAEALAEVEAAETARYAKLEAASDKRLKDIDSETAAYFRQAAAVAGLSKAGNDAEMQQLERAKYEDMKAYADAGYTEAAEQIGRYYDVLKSELVAKRELEQFDRESLKLQKERTDEELKLAEAKQRTSDAVKRQADRDRELQSFRASHAIGGMADQNGKWWYGNDKDADKAKSLENRLSAANKMVERARAIEENIRVKLENGNAADLQRRMERANLVAGGKDSIIRAMDQYDSYVSGVDRSRLVATNFGNWGADTLKDYQVADETQRSILEELRRFTATFERAIEGGD